MKQEVYCGFDMTEFNRIRDELDNANIKHKYKVVDLITPSDVIQRGTRTVNIDAPTKQYYVYVSRSDFEEASIIITKGQ